MACSRVNFAFSDVCVCTGKRNQDNRYKVAGHPFFVLLLKLWYPVRLLAATAAH